MNCFTCKSISGERRISPGPTIQETVHWLVEHAYPCSMTGWLVLVLKRHAEALHELTEEEFRELGELQGTSARVLFRMLDCEKEYSMCLAESEGFNHIHVHLVAKPRNLPAELRGVSIFALLKPGERTVPTHEIERFCQELKQQFANMEGAR